MDSQAVRSPGEHNWTRDLALALLPLAIALLPIWILAVTLFPSLFRSKGSDKLLLGSDETALLELDGQRWREAALELACVRAELNRAGAVSMQLLYEAVDAGSRQTTLLNALRAVMRRYPDDWTTAFHLVRALIAAGETSEAEDLCARMVQQADPSWAQWAQSRLERLARY